eukprot:4139461-Pleurochrysis_carterae.AAC.1
MPAPRRSAGRSQRRTAQRSECMLDSRSRRSMHTKSRLHRCIHVSDSGRDAVHVNGHSNTA